MLAEPKREGRPPKLPDEHKMFTRAERALQRLWWQTGYVPSMVVKRDSIVGLLPGGRLNPDARGGQVVAFTAPEEKRPDVPEWAYVLGRDGKLEPDPQAVSKRTEDDTLKSGPGYCEPFKKMDERLPEVDQDVTLCAQVQHRGLDVVMGGCAFMVARLRIVTGLDWEHTAERMASGVTVADAQRWYTQGINALAKAMFDGRLNL